jgi:anaerobic selenocysteine-containing dehydrogenase
MPTLRHRLSEVGSSNPEGVRFLLSAHAAHEELFLFRRVAEELLGANGAAAISVSWRVSEKQQPAKTTFKVPTVDAPNVNGARMFGLAPGAAGDPQGPADLSTLRRDVEAGRVAALYVFDPGFAGSMGDLQWVIDARKNGVLALLVVQGVLMTDLAQAADFVLPGASSFEKQASYSNDQGRLQGSSRAMPLPGDAMEDWRLITTLANGLGLSFSYQSDDDVRRDIAAQYADAAGLAGIAAMTFATPISARTWLQASNPSERWKWDFMYQDLPPVKGTVDPSSLPPSPMAIPLRVVK